MAKHGKRYNKAVEIYDCKKVYKMKDAAELLKKFPSTKFDETVELSFNLGVDPKYADQLVRGTVVIPHGTGNTVRVAVFAQGDKIAEAKNAGADHVGFKDLLEKVKGGWMEFDVAIAAPDTMGEVGKLGKVLGPKGLMPSPKAGTVTPNIAQAVKEVKAGRVEFRVDKQGTLHMVAGKKSFSKENLVENLYAAVEAVVKSKPATVKGQFIKSTTVSTSMGPGVKLDISELLVSK